jgi:hypothetical protein
LPESFYSYKERREEGSNMKKNLTPAIFGHILKTLAHSLFDA